MSRFCSETSHRVRSASLLVLAAVLAAGTARADDAPQFQFGFEYSVVSQRDFGRRFQVKLNVIPVIMGLLKNPIFGGG